MNERQPEYPPEFDAPECGTDTNTSLATFRRCAHEYELRYEQQLELAVEDREPLIVGHAWHKAFEYADREGDEVAGYEALQLHAPSRVWNEKLGRMYAAHRWYWKGQPLKVIEPEHTFAVDGYEGQIDGIVELEDGRRGILERKTSGEDIGAEASYWDRLRLDVQVGLYFLAAKAEGWAPTFILYDVARKPTISRKKISKADITRLTKELAKEGAANYYQELFDAEALAVPLEEARESINMYGARLTADIGDRPEFYFQRREVHRTEDDLARLADDIQGTARLIEFAREWSYPRNPDSCNAFGRCAFFALCSNNIFPDPSLKAPDGFRRREHRHPELAKPKA